MLQILQENTCAGVSFLIKFQALGLQLIKKEARAQAFFCEFCKIYKNPSFKEHLLETASVIN